jgi:hypothetical protein
LIAAKIDDAAILHYDFLNHCDPRGLTKALWQETLVPTVQRTTQILRGKLWRPELCRYSHFFHLKNR